MRESAPMRIDEIPAHWARVRSGAAALSDGARTFTWGELEAARHRLAGRLRELGVRAGDRVIVLGENGAALVALLFAVPSLDAWVTIVNPRLSAREVDAIRTHSGARAAVFLADGSSDVQGHAARAGARPFSSDDWGTLLATEASAQARAEPTQPDPSQQVAALVYTTGTTGEPKAVMLTHRNLLFVAAASRNLRALRDDDRVYGVLPLSHVYGLTSVCLGSLMSGACIELERRYSPAAMQAALARGITVCQGVPAMYAKLLEHLAARRESLHAPALRSIYCGGSPLSPSLKRDIEAAFGMPIHNGYGLTEAAPTLTQVRLGRTRDDCSVGEALPGVELRIVDGEGRDLPAGEAGELWARGPGIMKGYYRNPEATAATMREGGWLATGDIARLDADAALHVEGRLKELIIRSGFNVYPVEVEAVLNSHPEVTQSAVVGRAVADNEEVVAFVELVAGARCTAEELLAYASSALATYKRPAEVVILEALPATATGKVLKSRLAEEARRRARAAPLSSPASPGA
jgi:acyl-CoA synthetase (AMP-forming)/AMP-acid ligase II